MPPCRIFGSYSLTPGTVKAMPDPSRKSEYYGDAARPTVDTGKPHKRLRFVHVTSSLFPSKIDVGARQVVTLRGELERRIAAAGGRP